jgi:hypothetical protein
VAGHVDDVIDATHDAEISVSVTVAGVAGQIVPRVCAEIGLLETGVVVPERGQPPRIPPDPGARA